MNCLFLFENGTVKWIVNEPTPTATVLFRSEPKWRNIITSEYQPLYTTGPIIKWIDVEYAQRINHTNMANILLIGLEPFSHTSILNPAKMSNLFVNKYISILFFLREVIIS